jgi:hypothetical protein
MLSTKAGRDTARTIPVDPSHPDLINKPGVFMMISPEVLKVDTQYQRPVSGQRTDRIAESWSWIDCGVLTVALRGPSSGDYFVIDGQHRLEGAIRAGIHELPCMVFESREVADEALTFVNVNTNRRAVTIVEKYRAMLKYNDPGALYVEKLLKIANRVPESGGQKSGTQRAGTIMCLDFLLQAVDRYPETLDKIWPLMIELCDGELMTKRLLAGFCYIERFLTHTSVTESHWRRRILRVGYDKITTSIDETGKFERRYSTAICAQGILRAVNQGLRSRLQLTVAKETESVDA